MKGQASSPDASCDAHRSTAFPLALATVCLIVYASLYPFADWRNQGISPFRFLTAPFPKYWTGFDVGINLLGYAPFGFLLALAGLHRLRSALWAIGLAVLGAGLVSLSMEALQGYLPSRVPSSVDLALNTLGAALGAGGAWALSGAGQVFERLESALAEGLEDTPFLAWMPVRDVELQPLVPLAEVLCVALGLLIPCLLGYCIIRRFWQRTAFAVSAIAVGIGASALSAALSYGPQHAWAWLDVPVQAGLGLGAVLALLFLASPRRAAAALALLALAVHLSLLNQAPVNPYFAQTLQIWEQGRFIQFYGAVQWLGWIWPYAVMLYLLMRLSRREPLPLREQGDQGSRKIAG